MGRGIGRGGRGVRWEGWVLDGEGHWIGGGIRRGGVLHGEGYWEGREC